MEKWNPFKKNILNAEPEEGLNTNQDGYGVPRDASKADVLGVMPDAGQTSDTTGMADPAFAEADGSANPAADASAADGVKPAQEDGQGVLSGTDPAATADSAPDIAIEGEDAAVQDIPGEGEAKMPDVSAGEAPAFGTSDTPVSSDPGTDQTGSYTGIADTTGAADKNGSPEENGAGSVEGMPGSAGADFDAGMSGSAAAGFDTGMPEGAASAGPHAGADPDGNGFEAGMAGTAGAAGMAGTAGMGGAGPLGPDGPHDFDDDEPKFDTQTGERLDKPKKKFPAIVLTAAVTALALGAFIWAVDPEGLPSKKENKTEDPVETEVVLAIADEDSKAAVQDVTQAKETESEAAAVTPAEDSQTEASEQTETEQAKPSADETEADKTGREVKLSVAGEETSMTQTETEAQTESETEAGTEAQARTGAPQFKTEGVTVSASLDVSDMVEEVMPQIVSVTATSIQTVRDFFFGQQQFEQTDAGSGIIVDQDDSSLYIVTDAYILNGAQDVTVGFCVQKDLTEDLTDEDTFSPATLVGYDSDTGLALLKVSLEDINETVRSLIKPAVLGDSDKIRVGERAIAIGNAMGRGLSVTQGIISAVNRPAQYAGGIFDFIQTDASINYGNYGGALLNEAGEVIGINAGKITDDSSEGMGYAFPINQAKIVIEELLSSGEGQEAKQKEEKSASDKEEKSQKETKKQLETLAIADEQEETEDSQAMTPAQTEETKEETQAETPAQTEEVKEEAQTEAHSQEESELKENPETEAKQEEPVIMAAPETEKEARRQEESEDSDKGQLGIQIGEYSKEDQIIYRIPAGAVIADVVPGSGAEQAGLAAGDLICGIDDKVIETVKDVQNALSDKKPGDQIEVSYLRPDESQGYEDSKVEKVTVTLQ